jgi:MerR HTH family regulatory protein
MMTFYKAPKAEDTHSCVTQIMPDMRILIKIRALARLVGRSEATIRRWDEAGLFAPRRDRNGHRVYGPEDIEALRVLKASRKPGRPPKSAKAPA